MVQGAVFDAINSIDGKYEGYLVDERFPRWASIDAAGAQAAHDVLASLYPGQQAFFDSELAATLATVKDGKGEEMGIQAGQLAAARMLASRADDGAMVDVPYTANTDPGHWQPDPMNPTQNALGVHWGDVKPFVLGSTSEIAVPPAPAMTSTEYAAAYNEVKLLGGNGTTTPTARTADQTQIGLFWAYDVAPMGTPMVLYNQILKTISKQMHNSVVENARLFGLANLAMADAAIVTWDVKWDQDVWRPIAGIRNGDLDGNPLTIADPAWTPMGAPGDTYAPDFTPPFPAYTSGHAGFGAATFAVLREFYGTDKLHFTIGSDEYNPTLGGRQPVTRSFDSFSQANWENAISRIYLGVHWRFDATAGIALGEQIAARVMADSLSRHLQRHRQGDAGSADRLGFTPIVVTLVDPIIKQAEVATARGGKASLAEVVQSAIESVRAAGVSSTSHADLAPDWARPLLT
jgi:membrane-associated phospholipid phosphatase